MAVKIPTYTITLEVKTDAPEKLLRKKGAWIIDVVDETMDYVRIEVKRVLSVEAK